MSSSAQIGMVGCVNAIEEMRHDGAEIKRLRARIAEAYEECALIADSKDSVVAENIADAIRIRARAVKG